MQQTRTGVLGDKNIPCRTPRSTGSGSEYPELKFEFVSAFRRAQLSRLTAPANAGHQSISVDQQ